MNQHTPVTVLAFVVIFALIITTMEIRRNRTLIELERIHVMPIQVCIMDEDSYEDFRKCVEDDRAARIDKLLGR